MGINDLSNWVQLGILVTSIVGGLYQIYRMIASKFRGIETRLDALQDELKIHVDTEITKVNTRVDTLFIELLRGKNAGKNRKNSRDSA